MLKSNKTTNTAIERHCDLMRQGFTRMVSVDLPTEQQVRSAREHAAVILAKLDRRLTK